MDFNGWSSLPDHILVDIFAPLGLKDRHSCSLTCKNWSQAFCSPYLWKDFRFTFYFPEQTRLLKGCAKFVDHLQKVCIELDQSDAGNRENACAVLKQLSYAEERRLTSLEIKFMGENPFFYAGKEFVDALSMLFGRKTQDVEVIKTLDTLLLNKLTITLDDNIINTLSDHCLTLQTLNIQSRALVCKVSPASILNLVKHCKKLNDLRLHNCSLNDDILLAFTEDGRAPLKHLSVLCRREEKYGKDIDSDIWLKLKNKYPAFRVTLTFDHTCPLHKVSEVMKPEIPVAVLRLETFTYIYEEVKLAARIYDDVLEKLVLQTPLSKNSPELNQAIIELVTVCKKLTALHVYCILNKETVEKIHDLNPLFRQNKSYTLKYPEIADEAPWKGDELYIPGN